MTTTHTLEDLEFTITLADGSTLEHVGNWHSATRTGLRFQADMLEAAGFDRDSDVAALRLMGINVRDDRKVERCACDESDVYDGHAECPQHPN